MGKHKEIKVGDQFSTMDDELLTVVVYIDANNIQVVDAEGNSRITGAHALRNKFICWRKLDGTLRQTSSKKLQNRLVGTARQKMLEKYYIGSEWDSNRYGKFEIVEILDSTAVTIRWKSTGELQYNVTTNAIRTGSVVNNTIIAPPCLWLPEGSYTYMVTVRGEVVYIGMGKGPRYLHTIGGASGNRELNRLYFQGAELVVEIIEQGLTRQEAQLKEKVLIDKYRPRCNTIIYRVPMAV